MQSNSLTQGLKSIIRSALHHSAILPVASQLRRNQVAILTYHRVLPDARDPEVHPVGLFEAQMRYLRRWYDVVSIDEAYACSRGERKSSRYAVCVTFDDGYQNNYRYAWPVMRALGIPLTVYVVTGKIGTGERLWFDELELRVRTTGRSTVTVEAGGEGRTFDLKAGGCWAAGDRLKKYLRSLPHSEFRRALAQLFEALPAAPDPEPERNELMTWENVREMATEGATIGHHTLNHFLSPTLSSQDLAHEIGGGKKFLEDALQCPADSFCYPNGAFGEREIRAAETAGFRTAVTCEEAVVHGGSNPLRLPRLPAPTSGIAGLSYRLLLGCSQARLSKPAASASASQY